MILSAARPIRPRPLMATRAGGTALLPLPKPRGHLATSRNPSRLPMFPFLALTRLSFAACSPVSHGENPSPAGDRVPVHVTLAHMAMPAAWSVRRAAMQQAVVVHHQHLRRPQLEAQLKGWVIDDVGKNPSGPIVAFQNFRGQQRDAVRTVRKAHLL